MDFGNQTKTIECRFLRTDDFATLHATFGLAFSDYVVPFQMSEVQFQNHFRLNGVDLTQSVGAYVNEEMIGFTLNAPGPWRGRKTVYDAGTGVVPEARRQGAARKIFEFMRPPFESSGVEQFLLEVIETNTPAISLYESLGFRVTRRLAILELTEGFVLKRKPRYETTILETPDWDLLDRFGSGETSWQHSTDSMKRSIRKVVVGAWDGPRLIGHIAFFPPSGVIAQLAVDEEYRHRGVAVELLAAADQRLEEGRVLRAANVDDQLEEGLTFLRKTGFRESFAQLEMICELSPSAT